MAGKWYEKTLFLLGLFFFNGVMNAASLHISAKSVHGGGLQKIGVGKPFILEVTMHGISDMYAEPQIDGVQQLHKTGIQSRTINGDTTIVYTYRAVCDTPGKQKIGPAVLQKGNKTIVSNILELPVEEYEQVEKGYAGKKRSLITAELIVDKKDVYEQERITARVRAHLHDSISIHSISSPSLEKQFVVGHVADPITGKELVNGELRSYVEWSWNLYPRSSGSYVVPPFFIEYQEQIAPSWGNFFAMTDGKKQLSTNAVIISVKEVPNRDLLDGIAAISHVSLTVAPSHAQIGEGIVLTLEFDGDESVEMVQTPLLKNMPQSVRWHYSNTIIHNKKKRSMEYVVQGLEDGILTIPQQHYRFFNPETKQAVEMDTESVSITVKTTQKHEIQDQQQITLANQQGSALSDTPSQQVCECGFIIQSGGYKDIPVYDPMRWWLFYIMMVLPILFLFISKIGIIDYIKRLIYSQRRCLKNVCKTMHDRIKKAEQCAEYTQLYTLFILFFSDIKTIMNDKAVSTDNQLLHKARLKKEEYLQWHEFFEHITACSFDAETHIPQSFERTKALFVLAHEWVDRITRGLIS